MHRCLLTFAAFLLIFLASCGSSPTDVRTLVPADSLAYLESNDLGVLARSVTSAPSLKRLLRSEPDTSFLNGIKAVIAVTGFETSSEPAADDQAVLSLQPKFVFIAETNAWNYQAVRFTEEKLGEFVNERYGGGVELEVAEKHDGRFFTWTADDGRRAFALVQGSVIFFGNDETAIEKCLAVKRGEAESLVRSLPPTATDAIAAGFVSTDGVAQISNIAGIQLAMSAGEETEVQSFIARVLPEMIRGTVKDISWTATAAETGIKDRLVITGDAETAATLNRTMAPAGNFDVSMLQFVPAAASSVTRYNLKDPPSAWQSVVAASRKSTDRLSGELIAAFSASLFEPYGIEDPDNFLAAVGGDILTAKMSDDADPVVIAKIRDLEKLKKGIAKEIDLAKSPEKIGDAEVRRSADGDTMAAIIGSVVILGNAGDVEKCLAARGSGGFSEPRFAASDAPITTYGVDTATAGRLAGLFQDVNDADAAAVSTFIVETRFNEKGMERVTVSDLGLIGTILETLR